MLLEFRVSNFRSFRNEEAISFVTTVRRDERDIRLKESPLLKKNERVVPSLALYGANASGKSNVLDAILTASTLVLDSHRLFRPGDRIQREPFGWEGMKSQPTLFEFDFILEDLRYRYGFTFDDERVTEEWLYVWSKTNRRKKLFEREMDEFKFGNGAKGNNLEVIKDASRPNSLFLSIAAQFNNPQLSSIYNWFKARFKHVLEAGDGPHFGTLRYRTLRLLDYSLYTRSDDIYFSGVNRQGLTEFLRRDEFKRVIVEFVKLADLGIIDFEVTGIEGQEQAARVRVKHKSSSGDAWLSLNQESKGTKTLLEYILPLLDVLNHGGFLLIDEIESSLHPMIAMGLIDLFNDPNLNKHGSQLLFTTHNTHFLTERTRPSTKNESEAQKSKAAPLLRRDQIWFTEKDQEGSTRIYPLTDFKPRKHESLENGLLNGRYGAIPYLGDFHRLLEKI